ncbi:MAG: hypothetical protein ACK42G_05255, partial [Candidatus Kapaibacteriota bacterium]
SEDPVYGGDSLFPIDTVAKEQSVVVTATNAKFDLNILRLVTGADIFEGTGEDAYRWVLNKIGVVKKVGDDYIIDISSEGNVFSLDPAFSVMIMESGESLTEISTGEPK